MQAKAGRVFLVGAGPGDPELLTVKAARVLGSAEAVVYDRLVSDEIMALVPPGATRIDVGKSPGSQHASQGQINAILVRLARAGHRVVRLKGGDPFVFGRGGEEALHLARHGVAFEVVPGLTAATACAAYAGIPVTHRGTARTLTLVTGHCRADEPLNLDWARLADPEATLVVYMGLAQLGQIVAGLTGGGLGGDTPAAAIMHGTRATQRVVHAPLARLEAAVCEAGLSSPVLVVIGAVSALGAELAWFQGVGSADPLPAPARAAHA